ncbi:MAG TPA: CHAD domain-containing protein [Bacteroidia bacterium]|nr:CHAD domain-containing protein [Bacteroidia bacterium]
MLKKERQRNYFQERWHTVFVHFDQFAGHTNEHDLHKLRVELKKIKALLRLHEDMSGKLPAEREMKLLRDLFSQAGEIRNIQVSAQLVKKYKGGNTSFFTKQRKLVAEKAKEFVKDTRDNAGDLSELNATIWKNFRDISDRDILRWYKNKLRKLNSYFSPRLKTRELHQARKLIKRLTYTHRVLNSKLSGKLRLNTDYLHEIEALIGQWHDTVVALDLLRKQSPLHKTTLSKLAQQKQKLVEQVRVLTREFAIQVNVSKPVS